MPVDELSIARVASESSHENCKMVDWLKWLQVDEWVRPHG
jgi:hypothetical protein